MKRIAFAALLLSFTAAGALAADETPQMPKPTKEHEWLKQLEGEWDTKGKAVMGPGVEIECTGSVSTRLMGGFWAVSDIKSKFMDTPMAGLMTIGYDPRAKKYVGSWTDSMTDHLWRYEGSLDSSGKVLTLNAEGPNPMTGKLGKFRDAMEIKSNDELVLTSSMLTDEDKWVQFMTMNYTRKSPKIAEPAK